MPSSLDSIFGITSPSQPSPTGIPQSPPSTLGILGTPSKSTSDILGLSGDLGTGEWQRFGIFEKNTRTGEIRLHPIAGALSGLSDENTSKDENGKKIDSIIYKFADKDKTADDLDNFLYRKIDPSTTANSSDSGSERLKYQMSLGAQAQSVQEIGRQVSEFDRSLLLGLPAWQHELESSGADFFVNKIADVTEAIVGKKLSPEARQAVIDSESKRLKSMTTNSLLNKAAELLTGFNLSELSDEAKKQIASNARAQTPTEQKYTQKGRFIGPLLGSFVEAPQAISEGISLADTDKIHGGIADMVEGTRLLVESSIASVIEMYQTMFVGKAANLMAKGWGTASEIATASKGVPLSSYITQLGEQKMTNKFLSQFTGATFGAQAGQQTYEETTREYGISPLKATGLGAFVGVVSGKLENAAMIEMLGGEGTSATRAAAKEGIQEWAQNYVQAMAKVSADPEQTLRNINNWVIVAGQSLDSAIPGAASGAGFHMAHSAFGDKQNADNKSLRERSAPTIKLADLSREDLEKMQGEFGLFMRVLSETRPKEGNQLLPYQSEMLRAFADRFSNYEKIGEIVNDALKYALDPKTYGKEKALKDASQMQVFDSPVKDNATGDQLDDKDAIDMMSRRFESASDALDALQVQTGEATTTKHFQVAAQTKIDALQWVLDNVGMLHGDDHIAILKGLTDLYENGGATKLTQAQRDRLIALSRKAADVTGDPAAIEFHKTLVDSIMSTVKNAREANSSELYKMADQLSLSNLKDLTPEKIETHVQTVVDGIVEKFGTVMPDEVGERLNKLVEQIVNEANGQAAISDMDAKQVRSLYNAAKKVASIAPDHERSMRALRPTTGNDYIAEVRSFEWNTRSELRNKVMLASAVYEALTKNNVGMFLFPEEMKDVESLKDTDPNAYKRAKEKHETALEVFRMKVTKGIPGLTNQDIQEMLKDPDMRRQILTGLDQILTPSEFEDFVKMMDNPGYIPGGLDWQRISGERIDEMVDEQTRQYARRRANEISSSGQGTPIVAAMTVQDMKTFEEKRLAIEAAEEKRQQQSIKMQNHINSLAETMRQLESAIVAVQRDVNPDSSAFDSPADREARNRLSELQSELTAKKASIAQARAELVAAQKEDAGEEAKFLEGARQVINNYITRGIMDNRKDRKRDTLSYDHDQLAHIIVDVLHRSLLGQSSDNPGPIQYILNRAFYRAGILQHVDANSDVGFVRWLQANGHPAPDKLVPDRDPQAVERMMDWLRAKATTISPAMQVPNIRVESPNSAIVTDGSTEIDPNSGALQMRVKELKPGSNYTFTYPRDQMKFDPHVRGGDPNTVVGTLPEPGDGQVYQDFIKQFIDAKVATLRESVDRTEQKVDVTIEPDYENVSVYVGVSPVNSEFGDLYKLYQRHRARVQSGEEKIKNLAQLSVFADPLTQDDIKNIIFIYGHYLPEDSKERAKAIGWISGDKQATKAEYVTALRSVRGILDRLQNKMLGRLPSGSALAENIFGDAFEGGNGDAPETVFGYLAAKIDSFQASRLMRRLFSLGDGRKADVAQLLSRMANPSEKRNWNGQTFYTHLMELKGAIATHFQENSPGLTMRGENNVLTPDDYIKNPFLVIDDPSIPSGIQSLGLGLLGEVVAMRRDLALFHSLLKQAGYTHKAFSPAVIKKLDGIIGSEKSDVSAPELAKSLKHMEFDGDLIDSLVYMSRQFENASSAFKVKFSPLGLMNAMYQAGYSYRAMHANMAIVETMAKTLWRRVNKSNKFASPNDFYEKVIGRIYAMSPKLKNTKSDLRGEFIPSATGPSGEVMLFEPTESGTSDGWTFLHEMTHGLNMSGTLWEMLSKDNRHTLETWLGGSLARKGKISLDNLDKAIGFLADQDLQNGMTFVDKQGWRSVPFSEADRADLAPIYQVIPADANFTSPDALFWTDNKEEARAVFDSAPAGTSRLITAFVPRRHLDSFLRDKVLSTGEWSTSGKKLTEEQVQLATNRAGVGKFYFPFALQNTYAKTEKEVTKKVKRLKQVEGTTQFKPVVENVKQTVGDLTPNGYSFLADPAKGSAVTNSSRVYFNEDGELKAKRANYPRSFLQVVHPPTSSTTSTTVEEGIVHALHMAVMQSEVKDPKLNKAFESLREVFFDWMSSFSGDNNNPIISGIDVLSNQYPPVLVDAMLSLFGDDVASTKKLFHVGDNTISMVATVALNDVIKKRVGIDIKPLLQLSNKQKVENRRVLVENLRDLIEHKAILVNKDWTFSQSDVISNPRSFAMRLGFNWDSISADPKLREMFAQFHQSVVDRVDQTIRDLETRKLGDVGFKEDIQAVLGRPKTEKPIGKTIAMEVTNEIADAFLEERDATKALLEAVTPLAGEVDVYKFVMGQMDRVLGTLRPLAFSMDKTMKPQNVTEHVTNKLRMAMKWFDRAFTSPTRDLEDLTEKLGIPNIWWEIQTMGGIYQEAHSVLAEGVFLKNPDGSKTLIGEPLYGILSEIPAHLQDDVWRYLAARRELEIHDHRLQAAQNYAEAIRVWRENGGRGPEPRRPKPTFMELRNIQAASIVKNFIEAKYGHEGGVVGEFGKRIVDFGNHSVAEKLHHEGFLSDAELENLKTAGKWWIPLVKIDEMVEQSGAEPIMNDGTKEALRSLRGDWGHGIEHPLDAIATRATSVHLFVERQRVRNAVLSKLVTGIDGHLTSDELADIGIRQPTIQMEKEVTEEEWRNTPGPRRRKAGEVQSVKPTVYERAKEIQSQGMEADRSRRMKDATSRVWTISSDTPVTRETFATWAAEPRNASDAKKTFATWKNGVASYYTIDDPDLVRAMESIRPKELPALEFSFRGLMGLLGRSTNFMGKMITHTLQFASQMFFKDVFNAITRSQTGFRIGDFGEGVVQSLPYLIPELAVEFPETFKLWKDRQSSRSGQTSSLSLFQSGESAIVGTTGLFHKATEGSTTKKVLNAVKGHYQALETVRRNKEAVKKGYRPNYTTPLSTAKATINAFWDTFGNATAFGDAVLRMSERNAMKRGKGSKLITGTKDKIKYHPAYIDMSDRRLTLDFARKGTALSELSKWKMFSGPSFQDPIQIWEQLKTPGRMKSLVMKGAIAYTLPMLLNFFRWKDDREYQDSNWWDKFNYIFINKRKDGRFNRVPFGIGTLATIFRDLPLSVMHLIMEKDPKALNEFAALTVQNSPLSFLPFVQDDVDFWGNVMPSVIEPSYDVAVNRDPFSRAPVDYDVNKQNVKLPEERGLEKVGVTEDMLAHAPLGNNFSPRQWSFWIRKQFPGLANTIYGGANEAITNMVGNVTGERNVGSLYHPTDTNILNWKTGNPYGPASLPVNRALNLYQTAEQAYRTIKDMPQNSPKAQNIIARFPEVRFYNDLKSLDNRIRRAKIERGLFIKKYANTLDKEELDQKVRDAYDIPMTLWANSTLEHYNNWVFDNQPKPRR